MPAYIVDYDLHRPGQNYPRLSKAIEDHYETHWHMLGSTWIIQTFESAEQIHGNLAPQIDPNDKLFVAGLSGEAAWDGFFPKGTEWLKCALSS